MIDKTQNPAEIYLVPVFDGDHDHVWCDTPAPGEGMREEDATRYVREDIYLALQAQVEQLREVLRYADNKLYILTHNRKDVSPRLLTDADKGYKAVHEAVLGFEDNLNVFVAKRDAEIKAQAVEGFYRALMRSPNISVTGKEIISGIWLCSPVRELSQQAKGE
jgi:succinate dehydrogenase flavin-adding protein (antitoxin of CptAB toxin-antitoxin module)